MSTADLIRALNTQARTDTRAIADLRAQVAALTVQRDLARGLAADLEAAARATNCPVCNVRLTAPEPEPAVSVTDPFTDIDPEPVAVNDTPEPEPAAGDAMSKPTVEEIDALMDHVKARTPKPAAVCPFIEDVDDASMCVCGVPALTHDLVHPAPAAGTDTEERS